LEFTLSNFTFRERRFSKYKTAVFKFFWFPDASKTLPLLIQLPPHGRIRSRTHEPPIYLYFPAQHIFFYKFRLSSISFVVQFGIGEISYFQQLR